MKSQNINTLHLALTDIDSIAQGGCNSISSIARMALSWLEQPDSLKHTEVLADAFKVISNIASNTCDCINSEAEAVGCNWTDLEIEKRYKAVRESKVQS